MLRRLSWIGMLLLLVGCDAPEPVACFIPIIRTPTTQLATDQRLVMIDQILAIEPAPIQPVQLRFALTSDPSKVFVIDLSQQHNYFHLYQLESFFDIRLPYTLQCQLPDEPFHYTFTLEVVSGDQTDSQPLELAYQADINAFGYYSLDTSGAGTDIKFGPLVIVLAVITLLTLYKKIYIDFFALELYQHQAVKIALVVNIIMVLVIFNINYYKYLNSNPMYCYSFNGRNNQQSMMKGTIMLPNSIITQDIDNTLYPMYSTKDSYAFETSIHQYYHKHLPPIESMPGYPDCDDDYQFSYTDNYVIKHGDDIENHSISIIASRKPTLDQDIEVVRFENFIVALLVLIIFSIPIGFVIQSKR
ncbi:hypothetical protein [Herpetosiphon gulosus]|uniref:Uncharacterized protein n=1 Tax=Herpetosiphon gulosus TaxID=1973496 RepID=A0ABP9X3P7_9CHLR